MELIKNTVLEKLAKHKRTHSEQSSFIQRVQEGNITYERQYIRGKVDRYIIAQETVEEKEYWYVLGDYDQPGHYKAHHRCEWQQDFQWDTQTGSWQETPTEIRVKNWQEEKGIHSYLTITTPEVTKPLKDEGEGFAILWNFCLQQGEQEFQALKKAGYTLEDFKAKLELLDRIAKAKEKVTGNFGPSWQALKEAVKILAKNGQKGKAAARELIRIYQIEHQKQ